ncbi:MAG: sigma 54-interacting transcriptional regulator, partial [Thiobacillus sp.]|nr:sigma 54-interacting transcriptional regulator [Thiobacillus sp.]
EIGDLPMPLQAKLLRFLQERVIERLGGRGEIPVDVRVVCATHRDLAGMIREGGFREDLYYRLSEIAIQIPPLRERPGDAVLLAQAFLERNAREMGRGIKGFTADALAALEAHGWPGNVREMENMIKRATIMADGTQITAADLGLDNGPTELQPFNLRQAREHAERLAVSRALAHSEGNIAQAAELLGVTRPTLYDLMAKIGMK